MPSAPERAAAIAAHLSEHGGGPRQQELVPALFADGIDEDDPATAAHLRWMEQKDRMGQDVFLLGPPGSYRRRLAFRYLELAGRETEHLVITRDTTEAELRQRREIVGGNRTVYTDSAPVRAAVFGRVLVLEGIEKAERNVLPTLNNLLENREVQLDDGRFLMSHTRYDTLRRELGDAELGRRGLVRVSPRFRVVALGLPVPPYAGAPLDPPLRSRFQARFVSPPAPAELDSFPRVAAFAHAVNLPPEPPRGRLPTLTADAAERLGRTLRAPAPARPTAAEALRRAYPTHLLIGDPQAQEGVRQLLAHFGLEHGAAQPAPPPVSVSLSPAGADGAEALLRFGGEDGAAARCPVRVASQRADPGYVLTPALARLRASVLQDIALGHDVCLLGAAGEGKSHFVRALASELGYHGMVEYVFLYGDMTARDLTQRRVTDAAGSTGWAPSAAVRAAQEGALLVLDGLERVPADLLCALAPLLQDRQLPLHAAAGQGGEELLLRHDRWQARGKGVRIHPAFRVVALAAPPTAKANWLSEEVMGLFSFHEVPRADDAAEQAVLSALHPGLGAGGVLPQLVGLAARLRGGDNTQTRLSMRHLLRAARAAASGPPEGARARAAGCVARQLLLDALPRAHQEQLRAQLVAALGQGAAQAGQWEASSGGVRVCGDGTVMIGSVRCPLGTPRRPERVPSVPFVEIDRHNAVLEALARELFERGERHILLLGPQGVGKNRVTDFLLQTLRWEREYMQLHRDSTVQQLTAVPQLEDGRLTWRDSPVVVAAREGLCLMLDEADKAPLEVVVLLKSLVEDGQLALADGRRIVRDPPEGHGPEVIPLHPGFRMFVLANRPGFPFLGNDLFRECGDVFSVFCIDNPDPASETQLLRAVAPSVHSEVLGRLVRSFAVLRKHHQDGKLAYPYSTRELLHVVRHLHANPSSRVADGLANVLSFDRMDAAAAALLKPVFERHGIPVADVLSGAADAGGAATSWERAAELLRVRVRLARRAALRRAPAGRWGRVGALEQRSPVERARRDHLRPDDPRALPLQSLHYARADTFSELICAFRLPLPVRCTVVAAAASHSGRLYCLTAAPCALWACPDPVGPSGDAAECTVIQWGGFGASLQKNAAACWVNGRRVPASAPQLAWVPGAACVVVHMPGDAAPLVVIERSGQSARQLRLRPLLGKGPVWTVPVLGAAPSPGRSAALAPGDCVVLLDPADGRVYAVDVRRGLFRGAALGAPLQGEPTVTAQAIPGATLVSVAGYLVTFPECPDTDHPPVLRVARLHAEGGAPGPAGLAAAPAAAPGAALPGRGRDASGLCMHAVQGGAESSYSIDGLTADPAAAPSHPLPAPAGPAFGAALSGDAGSTVRAASGEVLELASAVEESVRWLPLPAPAPVAVGSAVSVMADGVELRRLCGAAWGPQMEGTAGANGRVAEIRGDAARVEISSFKQELWLPLAALRPPGGGPGAVVDVVDYPSAEEGRIAAAVTAGGGVALYQTDEGRLADSLATFLRVRGAGPLVDAAAESLRKAERKVTAQALAEGVGDQAAALEREAAKTRRELKRQKDREASGKPKHGEEDDKPHHGGNRFAGGSGGADTAGLGGKGGPYRLDKGHDVQQISDEAKKNISKEALEAARKMGREALAKRLKEIEMGHGEFEVYRSLLNDVEQEVGALRGVLRGLEAAQKERVWLKGTEGELDDNRLVDARAGERAVFKRRGDKRPGEAQWRPKRLVFLFDLSASMYRFNGVDGRLRASVEAAVMLMEALSGFDKQFEWTMVGHSGDGPEHDLVPFGQPPRNEADRLKVVQKMWAHSMHCASGDYTIAGIESAPRLFAAREATHGAADEQLAFAFSDANLSQYQITAERLSKALTSDPKTHGTMFFLAHNDGEAAKLCGQLPAGQAFVAVDVKRLPVLLKDIFAASVARVRGGSAPQQSRL
eukprot:TRINITY_DN22568_c0_g1_i1.p1 TRINITY_DN22568_c0_g1~~TRINITY_DN22568_c0_g1_i1.p1  ORF type:complete len:1930 (+),score=635.49 TRINITY_DN22568_c0_g1_i1:92-5881(+)